MVGNRLASAIYTSGFDFCTWRPRGFLCFHHNPGWTSHSRNDSRSRVFSTRLYIKCADKVSQRQTSAIYKWLGCGQHPRLVSYLDSMCMLGGGEAVSRAGSQLGSSPSSCSSDWCICDKESLQWKLICTPMEFMRASGMPYTGWIGNSNV